MGKWQWAKACPAESQSDGEVDNGEQVGSRQWQVNSPGFDYSQLALPAYHYQRISFEGINSQIVISDFVSINTTVYFLFNVRHLNPRKARSGSLQRR